MQFNRSSIEPSVMLEPESRRVTVNPHARFDILNEQHATLLPNVNTSETA